MVSLRAHLLVMRCEVSKGGVKCNALTAWMLQHRAICEEDLKLLSRGTPLIWFEVN